jgi:putative phage-type endonuclease
MSSIRDAKIDHYECARDDDADIADNDNHETDNHETDTDVTAPYSILPTDQERETIIDDALDELADVARENILEFKREDFDDNAVVGTWIDSYLCQYFAEIIDIGSHRSNYSTSTEAEADALNEVIDTYIRDLYDDIFERFYEEIAPPRVSPETHPVSHHPDVVDCFTKKIQILREKPQPEQRTPEWYSRRNNLITASAASKAFGTQASVNQLIYEKCKKFCASEDDGGGGGGGGGGPMQGSVNSPLHWGQRYEPVTVMVYEYRNQTKLGEFGCIQHDIYPFIGASPDGINIDPTSPIYGRMVEIKNIVNREITGRPKEEYWIQTQIQMEVCGLDECDFVETRFKEFESEEDYNTATNIEDDEKGIILWFQSAPTLSQQGHVVPPIQLYEYAPIGASVAEYERWEAEMFSKHERLRSIWVRTIYWYLDQYSCVLVKRNRLWFEEAVPVLEKLWNIVEEERKSGYDHRAPAKRKPAPTSDESQCSTGSIKIVKLNTSIMPEESQEVTSTNMASLITQQQQHQQQHQQHSNKYRQNPNKGPSDVLIKCFKIDDLEIIESKIEQ